MFAIKTLAVAAGLSLAMFGGQAMAAHHHHHHHGHGHGGFGFELNLAPDYSYDDSSDDADHVAWCYSHKPNYDEDTDMYYSHHHWKTCHAPFD